MTSPSMNTEKLQIAIKASIKFQKLVVTEGISLIERRAIHPSTYFRYAIMNQQKIKTNKFFMHPMALQRLSVFIMDIYKEIKREDDPKPVMLSILNHAQNRYLVVGVTRTSAETRKYQSHI